jgi:hypothetical protein
VYVGDAVAVVPARVQSLQLHSLSCVCSCNRAAVCCNSCCCGSPRTAVRVRWVHVCRKQPELLWQLLPCGCTLQQLLLRLTSHFRAKSSKYMFAGNSLSCCGSCYCAPLNCSSCWGSPRTAVRSRMGTCGWLHPLELHLVVASRSSWSA